MIYLIQASICTVLFYGVYHFFYQGKNNHTFNRFYLLGALVVSLMIPLLHLPVFPEYIEVAIKSQTSKKLTNQIEQVSPIFTWENILLTIYLIGTAISFLALGRRLYTLYRIIKSSEKRKEAGYTTVYTDYEITISSFLIYLIIPKGKADQITAFEMIHEQSHIRQWHTIDILFLEFYRVFFWFNPLVLLYQKRIKEVHEYLADEGTYMQVGKEKYENFLIEQIISKHQPILVHNFHSLFTKRINMMNTNSKIKAQNYLLIIPMIFVGLSLFSFKNYPVYAEADSDTSFVQDTIPPGGETIDTIIVFDPETKKESIHVVRRKNNKALVQFPDSGMQIDTVITFDPSTGKSSTQIIRKNQEENVKVANDLAKSLTSQTGIDTVVTFDPVTFEEIIFIINHDLGTRDTL